MKNKKIVIEFDLTEFPDFIDAMKARYSEEKEEEAIARLKSEIIELYLYGKQQIALNAILNK